MTIFFIAAISVLILLLIGQMIIMNLLVKRIQLLESTVADRDAQVFFDIQTMFRMQDLLNKKSAELNAANVCLEMMLEEESQELKDARICLEMVLNA